MIGSGAPRVPAKSSSKISEWKRSRWRSARDFVVWCVGRSQIRRVAVVGELDFESAARSPRPHRTSRSRGPSALKVAGMNDLAA